MCYRYRQNKRIQCYELAFRCFLISLHAMCSRFVLLRACVPPSDRSGWAVFSVSHAFFKCSHICAGVQCVHAYSFSFSDCVLPAVIIALVI